MVVVHVASDAFVGTAPQAVTVNVNLIVLLQYIQVQWVLRVC